MRELTERQQVAALGLDVVFAEPDGSTGLLSLEQLAHGELRDNRPFTDWLARAAPSLDGDRQLADALGQAPVALGYYFSSDRDARRSGALPAPWAQPDALPAGLLHWDGYGGNVPALTGAAQAAGFFNAVADPDGTVRAVPVLAGFGGALYESLALATLRLGLGRPPLRAEPLGAATGAPLQATKRRRMR